MMKLKKAILEFLSDEKSIPWIMVLIVIGVSIQKNIQGPSLYNNYLIYKSAFFHLIHYQDLYQYFFDEYNDVYLYTPTFALFMFPFVYFPMWLQLVLWTGANVLVVYIAIKLLPFDSGKKRIWFSWIIFFELITSLQNTQPSPIIAALIILAFIFFEKQQPFKATAFIILAAFIKIFALAAVILALLYPKRLRSIAYFIFWGIILAAAPLLVIPFKQLIYLYQGWFHLTLFVHQSQQTGINPNVTYPLSVMMWLKTWFNFSPPVLYVQLLGTAILCIPLLRFKNFSNIKFRFFLLSSLLIWCMIFNHISESASYIIAVMGVGIWFVAEDKNLFTYSLITLAIIFTVLSATDIFPHYVRLHFIEPYVIKAVPCIFIWIYIQYQLILKRFTAGTINSSIQ